MQRAKRQAQQDGQERVVDLGDMARNPRHEITAVGEDDAGAIELAAPSTKL